MQIRRFNEDQKVSIPGNHSGMFGVPIQIDRLLITAENEETIAQRFHGMPILLDTDLQVEMMYFDPHGFMEEHATDHPILVVAIQGQGLVRIGGPQGETCNIMAGEAILWPANTAHTIWTEGNTLQVLVINTPPERS